MIPIVAPDTTRDKPRKTRLGGPYDFMGRVIATDQGGGLYSQRQWMVEPVFAQIKTNRRTRQPHAEAKLCSPLIGGRRFWFSSWASGREQRGVAA
jgi:hypothetical protein